MSELLDFLVLNPDLTEEFKSFEIIGLEADTDTIFAQKDYLKKPFDTSLKGDVEEKHLIAWHEGDLTDAEKSAVNKAVAGNPELRRSFSLFGMVRLQPEASVVYPNKQELKKYVIGGFSTYLRQIAAAAAVVAFIASLYFMLPLINTTDEVAQNVQVEITTPEVPSNEQEQPVVEEQPAKEEADQHYSEETVQPEKQPQARPQQPSVQPSNRNVYLAQINPRKQSSLQANNQKPEVIETRKEFFWLTYADGMYFDEEEDETLAQAEPQTRYVSLAGLAYESFEKRTGISLTKAESQVSNLGFWDIAGIGLAGIGQLTGTPLTIDREKDENGRTRTFGIGDRFRIKW
jgi:hypothetical protein